MMLSQRMANFSLTCCLVLRSQVGGEWNSAWDSVWAMGPKGFGANILLSRVSAFAHSHDWLPSNVFSVASVPEGEPREPGWQERIKEIEGSILTGFQLSALSGPLCEEPMEGVAFIVDDIRLMYVTFGHI